MYGHLRFCSYRQGGNGFDDSVSPFLTSVGDLILGTMILLGCTHCLIDAIYGVFSRSQLPRIQDSHFG
jgi:hypothetical protein